MRRPDVIATERDNVQTIATVTDMFSTIASLQLGKTKRLVESSRLFFQPLWDLYTHLRIERDSDFDSYGEGLVKIKNKSLFLIVTSEGGFSGDIDQKVIRWVAKEYDPAKHDIICIGRHGSVLLAQLGITARQTFSLSDSLQNMPLQPIIAFVSEYSQVDAYFQAYNSLAVQEVKKISLMQAVLDLGATEYADDSIISNQNYIFEPSVEVVLGYLESVMLSVALGQIILESKLAQYAARFTAMSTASDRADDTVRELDMAHRRALRYVSDERLKEVVNGIKLAQARGGAVR